MQQHSFSMLLHVHALSDLEMNFWRLEMGNLTIRVPKLNSRDQKLKIGDFRRPRPNMGDQKSPNLPVHVLVLFSLLFFQPPLPS